MPFLRVIKLFALFYHNPVFISNPLSCYDGTSCNDAERHYSVIYHLFRKENLL